MENETNTSPKVKVQPHRYGRTQAHPSGDNDYVELNVLRCRLTHLGQTVTNACAWFSVALRPQKP